MPGTVNIIFSIKYAPWVCAYPNGYASHTVKSANVPPNELFPPDPPLKTVVGVTESSCFRLIQNQTI